MNAKSPAVASAAKPPVLVSDETLNALVLGGDLSKLTPNQKVEYYRGFCARIGLDPATHPFKLMTFQGKQVLYCDRGGTAQLNKLHVVSHKIMERRTEGEIYSVVANASIPNGQQTESTGAVSLAGLKGEALANAIMKAETKAKRRATLDLLGLGMLDESELGSLPDVQTATVVSSTPIADAPAAQQAQGQVETKQAQAAPAVDPNMSTDKAARFVYIRGQLNQELLAAKTVKEFQTARGKLTRAHGKEIESELTGVRPGETFASLLGEHWARIERALKAAGHAEHNAAWRTKLGTTFDVPQFRALEKQFLDGEVDQDAENSGAIDRKGKALKLPEYIGGAVSDSAQAAGQAPESGAPPAMDEDFNAEMEGGK